MCSDKTPLEYAPCELRNLADGYLIGLNNDSKMHNILILAYEKYITCPRCNSHWLFNNGKGLVTSMGFPYVPMLGACFSCLAGHTHDDAMSNGASEVLWSFYRPRSNIVFHHEEHNDIK